MTLYTLLNRLQRLPSNERQGYCTLNGEGTGLMVRFDPVSMAFSQGKMTYNELADCLGLFADSSLMGHDIVYDDGISRYGLTFGTGQVPLNGLSRPQRDKVRAVRHEPEFKKIQA